jgi:hypothetical protein
MGAKVSEGQTNNIVVNLSGSPVTPSQLETQLNNYPIPGLSRVIVAREVAPSCEVAGVRG